MIGTRRRQPQRLTALLATLAAKRERAAVEVEGRIAALQSEVSDAEEKLARLYKLVEDSVTDLDDILRAPISNLKLDRERAKASLDRAVSANHRPIEISPVAVELSAGRCARTLPLARSRSGRPGCALWSSGSRSTTRWSGSSGAKRHSKTPSPAKLSRRKKFADVCRNGAPKGTRTPVFAVRGRRPGPLDDGSGQGRVYIGAATRKQGAGAKKDPVLQGRTASALSPRVNRPRPPSSSAWQADRRPATMLARDETWNPPARANP